jgi:hypothetical protein
MNDDNPILAALARLEAEQSRTSQIVNTRLERMEAEQTRVRELVNTKLERILDEISTLRTDFQNTKGFLLDDAVVLGRRTLLVEDRLTRLERKLPD